MHCKVSGNSKVDVHLGRRGNYYNNNNDNDNTTNNNNNNNDDDTDDGNDSDNDNVNDNENIFLEDPRTLVTKLYFKIDIPPPPLNCGCL